MDKSVIIYPMCNHVLFLIFPKYCVVFNHHYSQTPQHKSHNSHIRHVTGHCLLAKNVKHGYRRRLLEGFFQLCDELCKVAITQSSVIIHSSLYDAQWICYLHCVFNIMRGFNLSLQNSAQNKNAAFWTVKGHLNWNTSDWPLHSRNQPTCLWFATFLNA